MSRWKPWDDYKTKEDGIESVKAPPCSDCPYWKPTLVFWLDGKFNGVHFCHSPNQFHDFSCYRERTSEVRK